MKLGVFSFNTEYSIRADELAVAAEARGFESVWFPEHTHIPASRLTPWPGNGPLPKEYTHMSDPFTSIAAAAAVTKTIKLGTGICLVVEHEPLALAKTVATVDRISNGRFLFGVGAGWNREEMENHGTPYAKRWKVLEERVKAMKILWTEEEASFHGEWVNFDRVWSFPKPVQQPHPPIILGTFGSVFGRQRVADFGDGWIPIDLFHGDLAADIADLKRRVRANGRNPEDVSISMFDIFETPEDDLRRFADSGVVLRAIPRCPTEDRDTVLRWLDRYAEIGRRIGAI
ncbi:MAG: LLM class F420-dependent oxidoreductase [Gammaproteobacteria bacterium]